MPVVLIERAERGEEIHIARAGTPVVKLVAIAPQKRPRVLGRDAGLFVVPDDFDAPLADVDFEG
jgi:prevent-host-death family protein